MPDKYCCGINTPSHEPPDLDVWVTEPKYECVCELGNRKSNCGIGKRVKLHLCEIYSLRIISYYLNYVFTVVFQFSDFLSKTSKVDLNTK